MALPGSIDIEVPIFGSVVVDRPPENLPIGTSPANQDVQYGPGYVRTRPGLAQAIPNNLPLTYLKTYVDQQGQNRTLYLDTDGNLMQDFPQGTQGNIFTGIAVNSYCKSVTAFGREYMAFSDGKVGTNIPRQYDGANFDRYTQSGPGRGPSISGVTPPFATIQDPGVPITATIAAPPTGFVRSVPVVVNIPPSGPRTYDSVVTITTTAPHGFTTGSTVFLSGVTGVTRGNGSFVITGTPTSTTFTFNELGAVGQTGGNGTAQEISGPGMVRSNNIVTVTTVGPHNFQAGWTVQIQNIPNIDHGVGIAGISQSNGVVTVITNAAHGLTADDTVIIAGVADASYNGTFQVAEVLGPEAFTYNAVTTDPISSGGTVSTTFDGIFVIQTILSNSTFTYNQIGPNEAAATASGLGNAQIQPQIAAGLHLVSVSFISRTGYITEPSPPILFNASGSELLGINDIPVGPDNIIARVLMFTPFLADVETFGNFFSVFPAMQINDNTTISAVIDFSDAVLQAGTSQNYLFDLHKLDDSAGVAFYNERLVWWGELNYIENFVNMDFDGGWDQIPPIAPGPPPTLVSPPRGWTLAIGTTGQGTSPTTSTDFGDALLITGDGATAPYGMITQPAYQDVFLDNIIQVNTDYSVRIRMIGGPDIISMSGPQVTVELFSPNLGSLGKFTAVNLLPPNLGPVYTGHLMLPQASIPNDLLLRVYSNHGFTGTVTIENVDIFPSKTPYVDAFRVSFASLPENLDAITGLIQISPSDGQRLTNAYKQGDYLYLTKEQSEQVTRDDGTNEPSLWSVQVISNTVGCCSINGAGSSLGNQGENWTVLPNRNGLFLAEGQNQPIKINQEIQDDPTDLGRPNWDDINWDFAHTIWSVVDIRNRFMVLGVPMFGATQPNMILYINFKVLGDSGGIATGSPVYVSSYTGRILSKETQRKWSWWSIGALCGALIERNDGIAHLFVGLTAAENYPTSSPIPDGWSLSVTADGGAYDLDNANTNDAIVTGGVLQNWTIHNYYQTAFLLDAGKRTELQQIINTSRILMDYLTFYMIGNGNLKIFTVLPGNTIIQSLPNPQAPNLALSDPAVRDFEVFINTTGERIALIFTPSYPPLTSGAPTNLNGWFEMSKLMPSMRSDPAIPSRGYN